MLSTSKRVRTPTLTHHSRVFEGGERANFESEDVFETAEKKKLFLKAKFDELSQDKRKLGKAMDKKRRKTSQKEKKQMPRTR